MHVMQLIQSALASTGIATYQAKYFADREAKQHPDPYLVYQVYTYEDRHLDDQITEFRHDIYISLYGSGDLSNAILAVRDAMYGIGYSMREERTDAEFDTRDYTVHWSWTGREMR